MIIYEVNLEIKLEISINYRSWLKKHMSDMLRIDGFDHANIYYQPELKEKDFITIQYFVSSMEHLKNYFQEKAEKMRKEAIFLFGDGFKASRRILEKISL
jgi:uncharacterized Fe-S cluster-containing protein